MAALLELNAVVTSVDIGTPSETMVTPLLGGAGRTAYLEVPVLPLTSTVLIQTAPAIDADTGTTPVEGSSLWETVATLTSASDQLQEITLGELVRWNTTVLDADGPNVKVYLRGIQ